MKEARAAKSAWKDCSEWVDDDVDDWEDRSGRTATVLRQLLRKVGLSGMEGVAGWVVLVAL